MLEGRRNAKHFLEKSMFCGALHRWLSFCAFHPCSNEAGRGSQGIHHLMSDNPIDSRSEQLYSLGRSQLDGFSCCLDIGSAHDNGLWQCPLNL